MDKLMLFRTIYLRSIAEAWANPTFHDALIENPVETMRAYFGFAWPWPSVCNLVVIENRAKLRWIEDRWVWARGGDEGLTLNLPLAPPAGTEHDAGQQSKALADWYRQRSSLFSDDWGLTKPRHGIITPEVGADSPPPDNGYMPSAQDFASFKVVLLAAIAKAWRDPRFRDKLQLDAKTALHDIRGYELPWDLAMYICHDPEARWQAPTAGDPPDQHQSCWYDETPHTLTLNLPPRPDDSDLASEPIALAMYNAAGARYPFTCCCDP